MEWICKVHRKPVNDPIGFDDLADSEKFDQLDFRLAAELMSLEKPPELTAEISRRINRLQDIASVLTGRQLFWLFCKWFATPLSPGRHGLL